jgi:hypothetical protein
MGRGSKSEATKGSGELLHSREPKHPSRSCSPAASTSQRRDNELTSLRPSQMTCFASPNRSAVTSSPPSDPSPFSTLPTELKLEILAWTGIASPRALCNLSSTNRELRKLSEPLRWKVSFRGIYMAPDPR